MTARACDSCRRRKVKCDGSAVCANCRTSQLHCQYTIPSRKRGPKVSRTVPLHDAPPPATIHTPSPTTQTDNGESQLWPSPTTRQYHAEFGNSFALSGSSPGFAPGNMTQKAQAIRDDLLQLITSALTPVSALEAVNSCIDLYMQYTFPTAPSVHEPTLRASALSFFSSTNTADVFQGHTRLEEIQNLRAFALLIALCASVSSVMPESLLAYRQVLAKPCLDASREIMRSIEDFDIAQPNSTSIAVRLFHSNALEHITGDSTLCYYILGQATLLIRSMRLHDEEALKSHDAIEAQLLRSLFWQIYAADQASACLRNRPFFLHELLFDGELSVRPHGESIIPMVDPAKLWSGDVFEERMLIGFHFLPRLWSSAAKLLSGIRIYGKENLGADKTHLIQKYMGFLGILDRLPHWLQAANVIISRDDSEGTQFQKTAFWTQRCTILVTFQCLRLVILQQCVDCKVWDVMGLNDEALTLSMVKIGIVNDFLQTLDDIPFIYLQIKGEPTASILAGVQRIRRVGSVLLQILDNVTDEIIVMRAEHYFARILDILAKLDSKSSAVLAELKELNPARFESSRALGESTTFLDLLSHQPP
ncbi:hypothetical protein DL95DRAFT_347294 [Leptodontidium sp. 2 PMI_412]|nr:hypothetical protein DL95DRAFT_347294 [Leptodontidium sp. 2 PMI_412]